MVITIDGPAGSGKSTAARILAKKLGFIHLNSGALFRAVALEARKRDVSLKSDDALCSIARELSFSFELNAEGSTYLLVDGKEFGKELSSQEAGELASQIGVHPKLREVLLLVQRNVASKSSVVVEGRDAGTVVFPDAALKVFLDGDVQVRAKRRLAELSEGNTKSSLSLEQLVQDLKKRDERDQTREIAPNVKASDAIVVDTTSLSVDEVVDSLLSLAKKASEKGS